MSAARSPEHYAIGRQIYAARKRKGLSQTELSRMLGLRDSAVSSIEVGRTSASAVLILRLATILDVSAASLLGEDDTAKARTREERALLSTFRRIPEDRRAGLHRVVDHRAQPESLPC